MDQLKKECFFAEERCAPPYTGTPQCVDVHRIHDLEKRGRLRLLPVGPSLISISTTEGAQGDVDGLPCGARTLVMDANTGAIDVRGINKFFDVDAVQRGWMEDARLWQQATVYATRKLAGFIISITSTNGVDLRVLSKHSADGPHVVLATNILHEALKEEEQARLANELHTWGAVLCCECIALAEDPSHPVREDASSDHKLIVFAIQRAHSLREWAMPMHMVQQHCHRWGLTCTPMHQLASSTELLAAIAATHVWEANLPALGAPLAEGLVFVVELHADASSHTQLSEDVVANDDVDGCGWILPIRLKQKTVRYVALRSLRSLLLRDSSPRSLIFAHAAMSWAAAAHVDVRRIVEEKGVGSVEDLIFQWVATHGNTRFRGADVKVSDAFCRILRITERQVMSHARCPLHLIILCGLPGSGKTELVRAMLAHLGKSSSSSSSSRSLHFVLHLSRDEVAARVAADLDMGPQASKHKQRRLGGFVHREMLARMNKVLEYVSICGGEGLLVVDACNATADGRHVWRRALPRQLLSHHVLHVVCDDAALRMQRMAGRVGHPTISDADAAQQAAYAVQKKFEVPTCATEDGAEVVEYNSMHEDAASAAERIVGLFSGPTRTSPSSSSSATTLILTDEELRERVMDRERELLYGAFGHVERLDDVVAPSTWKKRRPVIALQLRMPLEQLQLHAARALVPVLTDASSSSLSSSQQHPPSMLHRLATQATSWWRRWRGDEVAPSTNSHHQEQHVVVAGHTAWLRGWLFDGSSGASVADDVVLAALRDRFEVAPPSPHISLFVAGDDAHDADAEMQRFWQSSGMHVGQHVGFMVTDVLMDRRGWCLKVQLANGRVRQWSKDKHALHITLGTAEKTPTSYTGEMEQRFLEWENDNCALRQQQRVKSATRSRCKYHNFLQLHLDAPVMGSGTVVDLNALVHASASRKVAHVS